MATGKSAFRRRTIDPAAVSLAETVASSAPIVADVRLAGSQTQKAAQLQQATGLGSIQDQPGQAPAFIVGQAVAGGIYEVPLNLITSNPMPPRAMYPAEMVDQMAEQMEKNGQITAASGYINEAGGVTLIEGETRFRGARAKDWPTLRVEIRERPDQKQLYKTARDANVQRNQQTPLDDALRWKDMLAKGIFASQAAISRELEVPEDEVSRTIQLAQMPMRILHALSVEPSLLNLRMLNALREFWQVQGEEATLALILEIVSQGLGYRDVAKRRQAAERGPATKPRAATEAVSYRGAKGELKFFEKDRRLELVIKGLEPNDIDDLSRQLMSVFGKSDSASV
jgi:ParB family transcriptional regulator, chromosome partitioning protein